MPGIIKSIVSILITLCASSLYGQYQANGTAYNKGNDCFGFLLKSGFTAGSVWSLNEINLNDTLDVSVQFYLGCPEDDQTKGFVFAIQTLGSFVGNFSGNTGYEAITPSLAIELDIDKQVENGDPAYHHLALFSNGVLDHGSIQSLTDPVEIIEGQSSLLDCQYHDLRVLWIPEFSRMDVFVDCRLRIRTELPLFSLFGEYNRMFWGITSGNYLEANTLEVCPKNIEIIDQLADISLCVGAETRLQAPLEDVSYSWSPSEGVSDTTIANPIVKPDSTTLYSLFMMDGCGREYLEEVMINVVDNTVDFNFGPSDTIICGQSSLILNATWPEASYEWEDESTNPIREITNSKTYFITVTTPECETSDSIEVQFLNLPFLELPLDTLLCKESTLDVFREDAKAIYQWSDGSQESFVRILEAGTYGVTITNTCGQSTGQTYVETEDCERIYIPNVFSPNGDSMNDMFYIKLGDNLTELVSVQIFDRWGTVLFEAFNISASDVFEGWDGRFHYTNLPPGNYVYHLEALSTNGRKIVKSGIVTLIR